jgi:hypothetical protein
MSHQPSILYEELCYLIADTVPSVDEIRCEGWRDEIGCQYSRGDC